MLEFYVFIGLSIMHNIFNNLDKSKNIHDEDIKTMFHFKSLIQSNQKIIK